MAETGDAETEPVELSDEMLEAIRIIRSDNHQIALEDIREKHRVLVERLDKRDREREEERAARQAGEGAGEAVVEPVVPESVEPAVPEPPPVKKEPQTPVKQGRKKWHESGIYAKD